MIWFPEPLSRDAVLALPPPQVTPRPDAPTPRPLTYSQSLLGMEQAAARQGLVLTDFLAQPMTQAGLLLHWHLSAPCLVLPEQHFASLVLTQVHGSHHGPEFWLGVHRQGLPGLVLASWAAFRRGLRPIGNATWLAEQFDRSAGMALRELGSVTRRVQALQARQITEQSQWDGLMMDLFRLRLCRASRIRSIDATPQAQRNLWTVLSSVCAHAYAQLSPRSWLVRSLLIYNALTGALGRQAAWGSKSRGLRGKRR